MKLSQEVLPRKKEKESANRINTTKGPMFCFPVNLVVFEQNSSLSEV